VEVIYSGIGAKSSGIPILKWVGVSQNWATAAAYKILVSDCIMNKQNRKKHSAASRMVGG
jgi:hypothetical protein